MAFNGAGIRDTARVLNIGINTILRTLTPPRQVTSDQAAFNDVALICELDEQWSFVKNKRHRHWLWYAFDTKRKRVIAYTFGPRTDATCRQLLALLSPFQIGFTSPAGSYAREVPAENHLIGKIFTQRIERNNLTPRTMTPNLGRQFNSFMRQDASIEIMKSSASTRNI